jgi:D-alanyl-D-alanine carboxypeptidase
VSLDIADAIKALQAELGIPAEYGLEPLLAVYSESADTIEVGPNIVGKVQRLDPQTAVAWQQMTAAAVDDDINLLLISGYRSYEYQAELIRKKLKAGQAIQDILTVNVAPGYSQHHTGHAIDIATPGSKPLQEEFEQSDAFAWLTEHASQFGFSLSYPRDNSCGLTYEPWHWYRGQ